jgi:hypothetical protein
MPMNAKESWEYGNPEAVAIRKEGATCKGCKHEQFYTAFDLAVWICTTKDKNSMRRNHGKRCDQYRER